MNVSRPYSLARRALARGRSCAALAAACVLTMASNANAFTLPYLPLEIGAAYPPPNVMFILDISGSMEWTYMPDSVPSVSPEDISDQTYARNTIYYNPSVDYEAWMEHDGSRDVRSPAVSYTAARGGTTTIGSQVNLSNDPQVFYVPKPGATALGSTSSYYRYVIADGGGSISRAEYAAVTKANVVALTTINGTLNDGNQVTHQLDSVTAGKFLDITIQNTETGTNTRDLYYWVYPPTGSTVLCERQLSKGQSRSCPIDSTVAGQYRVIVQRQNSRSTNYRISGESYTTNSCDGVRSGNGWVNCGSHLPNPERNLSEEKQNFAMWYTYHRTRMKVAKAGASEAFQALPTSLRIGYTDIQNSSNKFPIPVGTNDGQFDGTNKETWFDRLHGATASGNTPLRTGLISVGEYYKSTSSSGPWGPEATARQLSCRQSFAILTTDGYWNTGLESSNTDAYSILTGTIGNEDQGTGTPYQDSRSDTLADIAMHYWKTDLRTGLTNNVPTSLGNSANWQHMVTFGISLGLQGTINPANVPEPGSAWVTPSTGWPNPIPGAGGSTTAGAAAIDDLLHASVNGRGQFVVANNAAEFQRGLLDAFSLVAQRTASSSGAASNSTQFTDNTRAFLAKFTSGVWSGELTGFRVTPGGVAPIWSAASQITAATTAGTRKFFTWDGDSGEPFPTAAQTTALDRSSGYLVPVTGAENVAYLKGNSSLERRFPGGFLRDRESPLGDIVHSVPAYSPDTQTVYVGANDGMLHAFDEATGAELFAYVPGILDFSELAEYSSPDYRHAYFVDGPIVVTTREQTPNKNYLVGALGHGGRGLYGLDVTGPGTFAKTNVLWEISGTSQADMGQVLGTPLIARLQNDSNVAIVGNGVNSTNGNAVLFVIDLATGSILHKIDTGVGGDNGLFAPRGADFDGDDRVDTVYAGDLKGNLWKFDFSGTPALALSGSPLFTAQADQSFTTADLALALDPDTGNLWVFAGSGRYLSNADVVDESVQSIYGIIDDGTSVPNLDALQERDITVITTEETAPDSGVFVPVRGFEENEPLPADKRGWYVDLDDPTEGERITTPLLVQQNVLSFLSRTPDFGVDPCSTGGRGWVNALDAFSGTSTENPYYNIGDGFIDPTTGDPDLPIGSHGIPNMGTGFFIIGDYMYISDTGGNFTIIPINPPAGDPRRASWHEVLSN
jgi:type IV pilus assembly protein PilY1